MAQSLNSVQKKLVNGTVRPALEKIVAMRYYLDALVAELDNQQNPIAANAEVLNDDPSADAPRSDAPQLTGQRVAQLRAFAANMRDQIDGVALNTLVSLMVRDVATVTGMNAINP
jgi:hypothetical protein